MKLWNITAAIVAWACKIDTWEKEFLFELFPQPYYTHLPFDELIPQKESHVQNTHAVIFNVENAGNDAKYTEIRNFLTSFQNVKVLAQLSDEWMGNGRKWKHGEGIELFHLYPPLALRQYGVFPYKDSLGQNISKVLQIPLGYMQGMLAHYRYNSSHLITSSEIANDNLHILSQHRQLNWSFIGTTRGRKERAHAIGIFSAWQNHTVDAGLTPPQMLEIYKQSKFVVIGRGQANLDCFRIYEAIIAGALPIIVGPKWEYDSEFYYEGNIPPFVHAESYEEALQICQSMSEEAIDRQRHAMIVWYIARLKYTQQRINWEIFHLNHTFTEWIRMDPKEAEQVYDAVWDYRHAHHVDSPALGIDKCGVGGDGRRKKHGHSQDNNTISIQEKEGEEDDDDKMTIYDKESYELEPHKEYDSLRNGES